MAHVSIRSVKKRFGEAQVLHGVSIEIADGSRTIAVGQQVRFRPLARFGHFQAGRVAKV